MTKTGSLANDKEEGKRIIENSQINLMLKFREVLKWLLQNKAVGHKNGGGGWWVKICYRILIESVGKSWKNIIYEAKNSVNELNWGLGVAGQRLVGLGKSRKEKTLQLEHKEEAVKEQQNLKAGVQWMNPA